MIAAMRPAAKDILTAFKLPGVGPMTLRKALGSGQQNLGLGGVVESGVERLRESVDYPTWDDAVTKAASVITACERLGIEIITFIDDCYPASLRGLKDYPPVLYVKGNVDALSGTNIAVVGTRHPSPVGELYATRVARELAIMGAGIVSGLALGVDAAAHMGALKAHGITIAVLAHGLDTVAPKSNAKLAERILDAGGALVSEHEPGIPPRRAEFVRRNRIQSGLSAASIVIESGEVGGSIHQARFTREQKRRLYAFVPPEDAPGAADFKRGGANLLAAEMGAEIVSSSQDLKRVWEAATAQAQ